MWGTKHQIPVHCWNSSKVLAWLLEKVRWEDTTVDSHPTCVRYLTGSLPFLSLIPDKNTLDGHYWSYFIELETEAQRGCVTCPRKHSQHVAERRVTPRSVGLLYFSPRMASKAWLPLQEGDPE